MERLRLVLEYMPDEELMRELEKERGKGRDDYPVRAMWNSILAGLEELLPGLGKKLAIDGKDIESLAKKETKNKKEDGRRDIDADWGKKEYKGKREDGRAWCKIKKWFGYRLHIIVDANYELPVAYEVTKASESEIKQAHKMIDKLEKRHPEVIERCETLAADRGYDDTKLYKKLWDEKEIKPVIDIRNM